MAENNNYTSSAAMNCILRKIIENNALIDASIHISDAEENNEHYIITPVSIKSKNENLNLIVKSTNKNATSCTNLQREIYFYNKIYTEMKKLQNDFNVREPFAAIPQCYKVQDNAIVLENMSDLGFKQWKISTMDEKHINLTIQEYGKLHAYSFAMEQSNSTQYNELTKDLKFVNKIQDQIFDCIKCVYDKFDQRGEEVVKNALVKFMNGFDKLLERLEDNKLKHRVVLHGDYEEGNIMFKYEMNSTNPKQVCFSNFENVFLSTPVCDLSCLLYCNSSKEIYENLDVHLKTYHEALSQNLKEMGCDVKVVYPLYAFKNDWRNYAKFGFAMAACKYGNEPNEENIRLLKELVINLFEHDFL